VVVKGFVERLVGHRPEVGVPITVGKETEFALSLITGIAAENKHIENRFQWNLGLQGFLFASYAIAIGKGPVTRTANEFSDIVALVGLISAAATFIGLWAAYAAINRMKAIWLGAEAQLDPVSARPFSDPWPSLLGRLPSTVITLTIFYAWFRMDKLL
jgi:hypothetical protein